MLNDYQAEMVAIFENNNYKVRPIKSEFDTSLMINHITRRIPKQNIYMQTENITSNRILGEQIDLFRSDMSYLSPNSAPLIFLRLGGDIRFLDPRGE